MTRDGRDETSRRARETLAQRVLDRVPAMVAYWGADQCNVVANAVYEQWFGFKPAQMRGVHIRTVLGEEVYAKNRPFIDGVLAGREQHFERTLVDASGAVRQTEATYVPDVVEGRVEGFFVLVTDVTARVEAEQALRQAVDQYRSLARSLPRSFVLVFDADLRFLVADGPALATFGLSREAMEGRTVGEAMPDRAPVVEPTYRAALAGETTTWDREVDGRTISLTAGPVRADDGAIFAGMVIGTDVTAERRREATALSLQRIAKTAAGGSSPDAIAKVVAETITDLFRADFGGVVRFEQGRAQPVVMAPHVPTALEGQDDLAAHPDMATARVLATGRACSARYTARSTGLPLQLYRGGVTVGMAAPILVNGLLWGTVSLGLKDEPLPGSGDDLLSRLTDFAEIVAISISSAEAWDALARLATRDPLTDLPNRRAFDDELGLAVDRCERERSTLSLAILDVDSLKAVNDGHGHPVGDDVLVAVAGVLASHADRYDFVGRIGGDEFGIVALGAEPEEFAGLIEATRRAIATLSVDGLSLSVSIGAHTARPPVLEPRLLVARADEALYGAKRSGRNRTSTTGPPGERQS